MRIISGTMRGTKLFTLEGINTRPTLDRVKEALFSKLSFRLENAIILDLFSGSGALGLEAISRGAQKAVLCDSSRDASKIIKKNVEKTKSNDKVIFYNCDYKQALEKVQKDRNKFDIIFLDPPYKTDFAENAVKIIVKQNLLNNDGIIVLETDDEEKVLNNLNTNDIDIVDIKRYGRVCLLFLVIKKEN